MTCGVQKLCPACPYSRTVEPGALGGSPVDRFIGQAFGPFVLPCHKHYPEGQWRNSIDTMLAIPQCAGAAVFRANLGLDKMLPESLHRLPADRAAVFSSPWEFIAHHLKITEMEAKQYLVRTPIMLMLKRELTSAELKMKSIAKGE